MEGIFSHFENDRELECIIPAPKPDKVFPTLTSRPRVLPVSPEEVWEETARPRPEESPEEVWAERGRPAPEEIPKPVSKKASRPSPDLAPVLRPEPRKNKRQRPHTACCDGQPVSTWWEPLGDAKPAFQYQSIENSQQDIMTSFSTLEQDAWIRLLKLSPSDSKNPPYELVQARHNDHPQYIAISYAWGDPEDTCYISIIQDSRQGWLNVPARLETALKTLKDKTKDVFVWADSVCINQQDSHEKSKQLPRIPEIYGKAEQVLVWLGAEKDGSEKAQRLLHDLAHAEVQLKPRSDLRSVVSLFDRDYWSRLWVVQEILHAKHIVVQCGSSQLSWDDYTQVSRFFQSDKDPLAQIRTLSHGTSDFNWPTASQHRLGPKQILMYHGPASILHVQNADELYANDPFYYLLYLLRLSRTKLASDPKDRVYGILGILPDKVRSKVRVDYQLTTKRIYIDVVEVLLMSEIMDVICESIHYPPQVSNANLPSWVPDWSYDPMVRSLASFPLSFSAGSGMDPSFTFYEERVDRPMRNQLLIVGVRIGTVETHGMAVNTHSRAADYCMAFLQWRSLLLQTFDLSPGVGSEDDSGGRRRRRVADCEHQRRFCLTLSLGQPIRTSSGRADGNMEETEKRWLRTCYCVFAKTIETRLPDLCTDDDLMAFAERGADMKPETARQVLQESFAECMMGRCFCITNSGDLGLGSGAMARGDVVVMPNGCSTPVLLRPEGSGDKYRYGKQIQKYRLIGDAYIHGYMDGEAMEWGDWEKFVLV